MFSKIKKEKFLWFGLSFCTALFVILFSVSPAVSAQTGSSDTSDYVAVLQQVMRFIQNYYVDDVDAKTLYEGAMKGMFESLGDPYSVFLTASDMNDLSDTTTGKFGGVGMYISKYYGDTSFDEKHLPYVRVVAPIEGTPAYRLGISAGDYIIKIGDKSTENMTLDEVLKLLRGEPGTKVNITILRGEDIVFSLDIVREDIVVPTVRMDMIGDDIAYLRIIQFTPMTPEDVRKGLEGFSERGYRSIIIDLRGNPGGLLNSVTDIADFFIGGEVIVSTRSKIPSENKVFRASDKIIVPRENPVLVLIDKGSASASEILAGAIKDNNRGFLVGEKTFGKGSVQQVRSIGESGFKLTMSRYYTPSGVNIDKVGILPDVEVREEEMSDEEAESYKVIIEKFMIQEFARENPNPSDSDISSFIARLEKEGLIFSERLIRRLIRNELNKNNNDPPVYDLEFDIVLQKAVEMIKTGEFPAR